MQNEKGKVPLPLIVFPSLSLNDSGVVENFERLNMYSKTFSSARGDKNAKLIVLIRHTNSYDFPREKFSSLDFISTGRGLFSLLIGALRYFKSRNTYPSTIIAGDPWKGFVVAHLLRKYIFKNSKLQIQIHGKIFAKPKMLSPKEILKFFLVKKSIREADSIRVVSNFQIEEILKGTKTNAKFVCAPIPIDFRKIPNDSYAFRQGIGFVGRIHEERGLELFASIVSELSRQKVRIPIFVIGDGPRKKRLIEVLTKEGCIDDVKFLGRLSGPDLKTQYSRMKILLSCAPEEGYGLTLREALLSGVMVIARDSNGAQSTREDYQSGIFLYKTVDEAVKIVKDIISGDKTYTSATKQRSEQEIMDNENMSAWVATW
jgi:glycosyltransferase involved in cell wall biosynthesis